MSAACGLGGDNDVQRGNVAMTRSEPSRRSMQGVLAGIYKKLGKSMSHVEEVRGDLQICTVTPDEINGFLITGDERIRVRFESDALGPLPVLRRHIDAQIASGVPALAIARIPVLISGRPWVEGDAHIVLLVRRFGLLVNLRGEA